MDTSSVWCKCGDSCNEQGARCSNCVSFDEDCIQALEENIAEIATLFEELISAAGVSIEPYKSHIQAIREVMGYSTTDDLLL